MLCKCYFNKLFLKKKKEERKCVKREDVVFSVKYYIFGRLKEMSIGKSLLRVVIWIIGDFRLSYFGGMMDVEVSWECVNEIFGGEEVKI